MILSAVVATAIALMGQPAFSQLASAPQSPGDVGRDGSSFLLRDGVVVDAGRSVVYVMSPGGGIDAVDLAGGEIVWRSRAAAKPLLLAGDLLVAQGEPGAGGALRVVTLDVSRQGEERLAAEVAMPRGARALVDDAPGETFRARASLAGGAAVVSWRMTKSGGVAPQGYLPAPAEGEAPAVDKAARRGEAAAAAPLELEGAARLDLASGHVSELTPAQRKALPAWPVADLAAAKPLKGVAGRQYVSADGRHVLASELRPSADLARLYRWTVYERDTGRLVGQAEHVASIEPFLVTGSSLVFASRPYKLRAGEEWLDEPLELRSVDLRSGTEQWSRPIRKTAFEGPFPP